VKTKPDGYFKNWPVATIVRPGNVKTKGPLRGYTGAEIEALLYLFSTPPSPAAADQLADTGRGEWQGNSWKRSKKAELATARLVQATLQELAALAASALDEEQVKKCRDVLDTLRVTARAKRKLRQYAARARRRRAAAETRQDKHWTRLWNSAGRRSAR
jgi:hypothetical protein